VAAGCEATHGTKDEVIHAPIHCHNRKPKPTRAARVCQQFADGQWVADQAAAAVLESFKRFVRQELELLQVRCEVDLPAGEAR